MTDSIDRASDDSELPLGDLAAAASPTGLDLLLLLACEPMTCETAEGFAMRLQRPITEVTAALASLTDRGVLHTSSVPCGRRNSSTSYWLPAETGVIRTLQGISRAYRTDPSTRRALRRAFSAQSPARAAA